jgi:hypothetical protein
VLNDPNLPFFEAMPNIGPTGKILRKPGSIMKSRSFAIAQATLTRSLDMIFVQSLSLKLIVRCLVLLNVQRLTRTRDHGYSVDERMKFAGHSNPRIFFNAYGSATSTVDGIPTTFDNRPLRSDHVGLFRGWLLRRHPRMWQSLPAQARYYLVSTSESIALTSEIEALSENIRSSTSEAQSAKDQARRQDL